MQRAREREKERQRERERARPSGLACAGPVKRKRGPFSNEATTGA